MRNAEKKFRDYLAARGLRFTPQRRAVLREVFSTHGHFDAEGLWHCLRAGERKVSRATVYRALKHLERCGLVREVLRRQGRAHYEHTLGHAHHDHMVCVRCGRVIEFSEPAIEEQQRRVCESHGFRPIEHRLGIRGVCAHCRSKEGEMQSDAEEPG